MITRVYQFGLLPPTSGEAAVRAQFRAGHDYANDLTAIERGRRWALRQIHDTPEVREAETVLRAATRSTRKAALKALTAARRAAERTASDVSSPEVIDAQTAYDAARAADKAASTTASRTLVRDRKHALRAACAAAGDRLEQIALLDESIRRDARALTSCYWGGYLRVEASADQARKAPLYGDDGLTPSDPRFRVGPRTRELFGDSDPRRAWWHGDAQVGVQLQGGLAHGDALRCEDSRVRLELQPAEPEPPGPPRANPRPRYGTLWLRVGSDGRAPVWATWPVKMHRAIPDNTTWKWCRVSCRREGPRERWTCEITIEIPGEHPRTLDRELSGAIAVEVAWEPQGDGGIRVARWADSRGERGEVVLPAEIVRGIRKGDGLRAVRDLVLNEMRPRLAGALRRHAAPLPSWLATEAATVHLWTSHGRFHRLAMRWQRERCDAAREAYEILDAWRQRDTHLWEYEAHGRDDALRRRLDWYRKLAAGWARQYRTVILDDRDLSREARWGEDSDVRQTAAPAELRGAEGGGGALPHAFGGSVVWDVWRDHDPEDPPETTWPERAIERWRAAEEAGVTREGAESSGSAEVRGGAWARRRARSAERRRSDGGARDAVGKSSE